MSEARALERLDRGRVDAVVLAEDEAAQERRGGVRCPGRERELRSLAHPVEQPEEPLAALVADGSIERVGEDAARSRGGRDRRARTSLGSRTVPVASTAAPMSRSATGSGATTSSLPGRRVDADVDLAVGRAAGPRRRTRATVALAPGASSSAPASIAATGARPARLPRRPPSAPPGQSQSGEPGGRALAASATGSEQGERERGEGGRGQQRRRRRRGRRRPSARQSPAASAGDRRQAPAQGWSRSRSASIVAGPIPLIWSSSSIEERPPCSSRKAMMSPAVTGPMPSIVSSCSTVAVPRLIGPSAHRRRPRRGARRRAVDPCRHHDLLAVGELRRQVDRVGGAPSRVTPPARSTASVTRDPAGELVDARVADLAGDVDDQPSPAALELERTARPAASATPPYPASACVRRPQPARAEQQQRDGDRAVDEQLRAAELGHARDRAAGRLTGGAQAVPGRLLDSKALEALGLLLEHLDPLDLGAARARAGRSRPSPRPPPRRPRRPPRRSRRRGWSTEPATPRSSAQPADRVAEEDALDAAVDDHPAADHRDLATTRSRRRRSRSPGWRAGGCRARRPRPPATAPRPAPAADRRRWRPRGRSPAGSGPGRRR